MPLYQTESKHVMNLEFERKKEIERRRNLRLLQVRHQSKDFARVIRESLKEEENERRDKFLECKKKQLHEKKTEDLKRLQQLYEICLESIGESHREAANQPDYVLTKQLEEAEKHAKASQRGMEARRKQKVLENVERDKIEVPRKIKKATRKKEDLRAQVISSLPIKTTTNHTLSQKPTSTTSAVSVPEEERPVLKELSSNIARTQAPESNVSTKEGFKSTGQLLSGKPIYVTDNLTNESSTEENLKECSCDYQVCWCHQKTSPSSLRRSRSESVLIDSPTEREEKPDNSYKASKTRSRSCSPRSVRTLNYCDVGNLYESNQRNFVKVTHHSSPPKTKEDSSRYQIAAEQLLAKRADSEELKKKTSERSARALQREKLKREWQLLMQDFKQISRAKIENRNKFKPQVAVYQRARDVDEKKEAKQKKLVDAFEKFLCSKKTVDPKVPHTNNLEPLEEEEVSLPTLNLAEYQQLDVDDQTCNPSQLTNTMQFSVSNSESQSQVSQSLSRSEAALQERARAGGVSPSLCQQATSEVSMSNLVTGAESLQATSEVCSATHRSRAGGKSPCQSSPSGHSKSSHHKSHRSRSKSRGNSQVTIRTPSNVVHIDVEPKGESRKHHKKCTKSQYSVAGDSSTSYGSPPQNLTPSQRELVERLLNQVSRQAIKKDLRKYILKLLSMSRESIDELYVSSGDCANDSPQQNINDDLTKLSNLTELYADKVNTLVDIFEEFDEQYSPDRYNSPPPAPCMDNSPNPSPNWIGPQKPPSPSSPCPNIPFSSGLPGPSNPFGPGPSCPFDDQFHTPNWELEEQFFTPQGASPCPPPPVQGAAPGPFQGAPRGQTSTRQRSPATTTPASHRPTRKPVTPPIYDGARSRSKSPQTSCPPQRQQPCSPQPKSAQKKPAAKKPPCALPPCHMGPCSPTPAQRGGRPTTPQRSPCPPTTQATPPSSSRGPSPSPPHQQLFQDQVKTPFGLSSNLLPHPNEAFQPQPGPSAPQTGYYKPGAVSVPPNFQTILEESENSSFDPFCGLPGGHPSSVSPVTDHELPGHAQGNFRNVQEMNAAMDRFNRYKGGELSLAGGFCPTQDSFGGAPDYGNEASLNFTDGFGGAQNFFDDFGAAQFGDEEFGGDINDILQSQAPQDEGPGYPADFPPQVDVFGPGFDWDAANLSEPSWPHSYPYGSIGGHDMSSKHHIAIDSSFDANVVSYPLNPEKLNSIRKKLSDISNDQYRQVIQMLQADCDEDQDMYNKLLKRVASGPFEDPNSTLAPIPQRSPAKPQRSSPQSSSRDSSRVSSAFDKSSPHNQPIDNLTSLAILAKSLNDSNGKSC